MSRGDFDNDGFDDLAIGVPSEDVGAINGAGGLCCINFVRHKL